MLRQDLVNAKLTNPMVVSGNRMASLAVAATAEMPIEVTWPPVLYLDPNGAARTVLLPPEAESVGLTFHIRNTADAAETLTVEEDSSTTSIMALTQGQYGVVHCDGTTWRRIG